MEMCFLKRKIFYNFTTWYAVDQKNDSLVVSHKPQASLIKKKRNLNHPYTSKITAVKRFSSYLKNLRFVAYKVRCILGVECFIFLFLPLFCHFRYDPYEKKLTEEHYDHTRLRESRTMAILKARQASRVGFILGTLGRQGSPQVLNTLMVSFIGSLLDSTLRINFGATMVTNDPESFDMSVFFFFFMRKMCFSSKPNQNKKNAKYEKRMKEK